MYYKMGQMKGCLYKLYFDFYMSFRSNSKCAQTTDHYISNTQSLNRDGQGYFHNAFSYKNGTPLKIQKLKKNPVQIRRENGGGY